MVNAGSFLGMPADVVCHFDVGTVASFFVPAVEVYPPTFQIGVLTDLFVELCAVAGLVDGIVCIVTLGEPYIVQMCQIFQPLGNGLGGNNLPIFFQNGLHFD